MKLYDKKKKDQDSILFDNRALLMLFARQVVLMVAVIALAVMLVCLSGRWLKDTWRSGLRTFD